MIAEKDEKVDQEQRIVERNGGLRSDDPHIIALARVGNVRILCSFDEDLHVDFKKKQFVDLPRGRIYLGNVHDHLLR